MDLLAEQELQEANHYLVRFEKAHHLFTLFMGGSLVSVAALPVLLLVNWLLGLESLFKGAVAGFSVVGVSVVLGLWWGLQSRSLFKQVQSHCLKLQRAGFFIYKKPVFLRNVLGAARESPNSGLQILDFERLTPWDLHYQMI